MASLDRPLVQLGIEKHCRDGVNPYDFALVCLLGLLGLRIFETVGADIDDLGEEHGHRVPTGRGKGGKVVLVPLPAAVSRSVDRAARERSIGPLLLNRRGCGRTARRHPPTSSPGGPRWCPLTADAPTHAQAHLRDHDARAGVALRDVQIAARHADPRTTMRYDRARKNLDRHPNYILAAYMASGT